MGFDPSIHGCCHSPLRVRSMTKGLSVTLCTGPSIGRRSAYRASAPPPVRFYSVGLRPAWSSP